MLDYTVLLLSLPVLPQVDSWGYSGALLLQAGLLLHIVPAAMLYSGQKEKEVDRGEGGRGAGGAKVQHRGSMISGGVKPGKL